MLQHQQEEETTGYVSPISNLRVTPQELAQAVAAIESRREGTNADTIAIGDAIEQLGLSVSAQEVYAEIQKQQSVNRETVAPIATPVATTRRRGRFRLFALSLLLSGSIALNMFLFVVARNFQAHLRPFPMQSYYSLSLSAVTDSTPGYATLYQLHELANGASPSATMLKGSLSPHTSEEAQWEVSKLDGKYVVRGWRYPDGEFYMNQNWVHGDKSNFFSQKLDDKMLPRTVDLDVFNAVKDPEWVAMSGEQGVRIPPQK